MVFPVISVSQGLILKRSGGGSDGAAHGHDAARRQDIGFGRNGNDRIAWNAIELIVVEVLNGRLIADHDSVACRETSSHLRQNTEREIERVMRGQCLGG